jgi:hypothetical protein
MKTPYGNLGTYSAQTAAASRYQPETTGLGPTGPRSPDAQVRHETPARAGEVRKR